MGDIGSGSGSSYPSALDTHNNLEVNSPNAGKTKARAEVPNDLAAAIVAIETELGTDPAGTASNVKTFLQVEHETDGTHATITTNTINEGTAGTGVTIDSVLCKDSNITVTSVVTDTIAEKTAAAGVTIDSLLIKDGGLPNIGVSSLKTYTSSDQTITSAGVLTLAHSLGAVPAIVSCFLVCQTGEFNYTAGDIVCIGNDAITSSSPYGMSITVDATNLTIRFGVNASTFVLLDKTAGTGPSALTNANWKLRVKAWA